MATKITGIVTPVNNEYITSNNLSGLVVKIFLSTFSEEKELLTIPVKEDGSFAAEAVVPKSTMLVAKLFMQAGTKKEKLVTQNGPHCPKDTVNISFSYEAGKYGQPLYTQAKQRLQPLMQRRLFASLSDEEKRKLQCLAGVSTQLLYRLTSTERLLEDAKAAIKECRAKTNKAAQKAAATDTGSTDILEAVLFVLCKNDNTITLDKALTVSAGQLEKKIATAVAENDIPAMADTASLINALVKLRDCMLLNAQYDEQYYDAKIIYCSSAVAAEKSDLLNKVLENGGLTSWLNQNSSTLNTQAKSRKASAARAAKKAATARAGNDEALKNELKTIVELDSHLKKFPPLLAIVMAGPARKQSVLNIENLATKTEDDWQKLIQTIPGNTRYPKTYTDSKNAVTRYAAEIAGSFSRSYAPVAALSKISRSKIAGKTGIVKALTANPGFDITKQAASVYFTVTDKPVKPNELSQKDMQSLQQLQRSIKLVNGIENMQHAEALIAAGAASSAQIVLMGKQGFTKLMTDNKINAAAANDIYQRAANTHNTIKMLAVNYLRYESRQALVPRYLQYQQEENSAGGLPDMESIFGSLNTCSCSECQSVYSAAAYLTDMLHWLKGNFACGTSVVDGLTTLSKTGKQPRREDIRYIKLNCKNTNEKLPYIDLVNEILSINLSPAPDYSILQTTKTSKELIAEPEHRFPGQEEKLTKAFFPFTLPYDAAWDGAVTYLNQLGITQHELVNGFSSGSDKYNTATWAKAYLGLSDAEFDLIIKSHKGETNFWKDYWGLQAATSTVGAILNSTGLSLEGLKEYLNSFYISGSDKPMAIKPPDDDLDECNIDAYTVEPFNMEIADRFMRFMRVRNKTGLSVTELDLAIRSFGNDIDGNFLVQLASSMAFCKRHTLSFTELMVWFGARAYQDLFNPSKTSMYYENTYRSSSFPESTIAFFNTALISDNCINTSIGSISDENKMQVCRVLAINPVEFDYLTDFIGYDIGDYLTLPNLAVYHRWAVFCRTFGIEITELADLFRLIANPFSGTGATMQKIWKFKTEFDDFSKLNKHPGELRNLVMGKGRYKLTSAGKAVYPAFDKEARDLWDKMMQALESARNANPKAYLDEAAAPGQEVKNFPVKAADIDLFKGIIAGQISEGLGLDKENTSSLINHYSPAWLYNFTYYDALTPLSWKPGIAGNFTQLYRYLLRVSVLAKACGLTHEGLAEGIKQEHSGLSPLLKQAFYWLKNNFTVSNFNSGLVWIKKGTGQAAVTGISQEEYLKHCGYINTYTLNHITDPPAIIAATLYNAMGEQSPFKKMSVYQFSEMYFKTQALAVTPKDMVSVLESCMSMEKTCQSANIDFEDGWSWVRSNTLSGLQYPFISIANRYNDIKRVLRSRYKDDDAWFAFITPVHNGMRMRLRDALVAYYIGKAGFKNENAIYAYFLIDPEMEPCMKTSRIVQANASVQLLVHRSLMGLEPAMCVDDEDKKEWQWRKNYQVWIANRKVFLYPENWIEPSLRLDKTPFFKEAEDILQQDEINTENCEKAFATYLGNLNNVARLDIRGTYVEELNGGLNPAIIDLEQETHDTVTTAGSEPEIILHVIGRTWSPPYAYFYRKRERNVWTAWEKIELDIEGDHLMPVIFNRRLYLFWPLFIEKEHRTIKRTINDEEQNAPYYEIKICCSKLESGKWSSKKILDGFIYAGQYCGPGVFKNLERKLGKGIPPPTQSIVSNPSWNPSLWNNSYSGRVFYGWPDLLAPFGPHKLVWTTGDTLRPNLVLENANFQDYSFVSLEKKDFYFWAEKQDSGNLIIHTRRYFDKSWNDKHASYTEFAYEDSFLINNCNDIAEIIPPQVKETGYLEKRFLSRPWLTVPYAQQMRKGLDGNDVLSRFQGQDYAELYIKFEESYQGDHGNGEGLLTKTHSEYTLTYPHQYKHNLWNQPFFYSDKQNTFFIQLYGQQMFWTKPLLKWMGYFQDFQHPYACMMTAELNKAGVVGLLNAKNNELERQEASNTEQYFPTYYDKYPFYAFKELPEKGFDFALTGSYSIYNWEIFFHTVSLIATQLRQNNKFADAIKWLQYVFDPTNRDMQYGSLRYWKIQPFMKDVSQGSIQNLLRLLSSTGLSTEEEAQKTELEAQVEEWKKHPFEPHKIASMRNRAYMLWTVMEYIETLTDWGDWLFRQFTMESVNEAINLYIMASEILGQRPKKMEKQKSTDNSFNDIEAGLDAFSNVSTSFENHLTGMSAGELIASDHGANLADLFFCIPDNPKLKELWDRVDDRLFKIRHCMDITGQKRELALFQPPIDPALLVRATAMGLDLSEVLSDLAVPLPRYRFSFLLQKATDFCNEVKSLGGQLLSALEKKDGEELAQIRQVHEQNMLKAARNIKKLQLDDAKNNYASLQHSKKLIEIRLNDYMNREYISSREQKTISLTKKAEGFMYAEQGVNLIAAVTANIPDLHAGYTPLLKLPGGEKFSDMSRAIGTALGAISSVFRNMATMSSTYAGYDRRQEDWNLQIKTATEELNQMEKQLLGAEIRIAISEKELENHDLQAEQSKEIYDYMRGKFTGKELYSWMSGELMKLHRTAYTLAYDMAKQAQQAFYKELSADADPIINFGHWDSGRKGLLAGERLSVELKQLDAAYIKYNAREYELTKHISLALLDPFALITLRTTGKCTFEIQEALYDMDYPGHFFRRIKSASVSIPVIAGPFTSVGARLSLVKSKYRKNTGTNSSQDPYAESPLNSDDRFVYNFGTIESIATSSAQNDSGVFELNFREEKYMPFEGSGALSSWELEFPSTYNQFDYNSISDVILHVKYTARDGGDDLKNKANNSITGQLNNIKQSLSKTGLHFAINLKHDMPNEWHLLKKTGNTEIVIDKSRLPYMIQNLENIEIDEMTVLSDSVSKFDPETVLSPLTVLNMSIPFIAKPELKLFSGQILSLNGALNFGSSISLSKAADDFNNLVIILKLIIK